MRLAVAQKNLSSDNVKAFSKVSQYTYKICVPATFEVRWPPHELARLDAKNAYRLYKYLARETFDVSSTISHRATTAISSRNLILSTGFESDNVASYQNLRAWTEPFKSLLLASSRLFKLALRIADLLDRVTSFAYLTELKQLTSMDRGAGYGC